MILLADNKVAGTAQLWYVLHLLQLCNSDKLWKKIYGTHCDHISQELEDLADREGWRRLFFTNKLQLQVPAITFHSANSTDEKLMISFSYFSQKIGFSIPFKLSLNTLQAG